jgi:formiminotetrahydrofolate cyclodeaminase
MKGSLWHAPLGECQSDIAAAKPAPAGVATACVTAALGLSLLIKVLRITGQCGNRLPPAEHLIAELRAIADADVNAVYAYIQTRNATGLREVPERALRAARQAVDLCAQTAPHITGLISADVAAASALLEGSIKAIEACIAANQA